jgi:hypothetical protein
MHDLPQAGSNGFRCTFEPSCYQICASVREMNRHLREIHHDLSYFGKKGRPAKGREAPIASPHFRSGVYYQRLFLKGPRSEYFEVDPEARPAQVSDQEVAMKDFFKNRSCQRWQ